MTDRTCALTQSCPLSLTKALNACFVACDLSDVELAYACLERLLARPRPRDEDDTDTCDGIAAIIRFITDAMSRREAHTVAALQTLSAIIQRERDEDTL